MGAMRDRVVSLTTSQGLAQVNWKMHEQNILDYFKTSTGRSDWTKHTALQISWCTYFVHWVLVRAGVSPTPHVGDSNSLGKLNSCSRFIKSMGGCYDSLPLEKATPQPGDMFYKPVPNNHIGLIIKVEPNGAIWSVNGNSGPDNGGPLYDTSEITKDDKGVVHHPIGYGYVFPSQQAKKYTPGQVLLIRLPDTP